jgi:FkbM family methyltransferase
VSEIPKGALSRLHLLEKDLRDERGWDILITKSVERVASSKFVFLLGSENQIVFSNAKKLVDTRLLTLKRRDGYQFRVKVYNDDSTDYIVDQIFNEMCYPILDFVTNVEVIIDIGANIGLASSYFRIFYPNASIYCFELNYAAIHLLKLNSLSIENCYVYPFGLYSDDTTKVFYSGLQTTRHTSVYRSSCVGFPQLAYLRKASHFLKSIDIDKVDILKIDTEGCELQILKDLFEKLSTIKVIYLEFHSEEDRRLIDQLLNPTHVLWRGDIVHAHRGNLCYLNRNCVPKDSPIEPLR